MRSRLTADSVDTGLSLVEVLVAILILSIAVVGAFRVFDMGLARAGDERALVLAELVALNRAAELRLGGNDLPGDVELGGQRWSVRVDQATTAGGFVEATVTVTPETGEQGTRLVVWTQRGAAR